MACGKGYEVHRAWHGSPGENQGARRGDGGCCPHSGSSTKVFCLKTWYTDVRICQVTYLCIFCDTVYSNVYSPVYFSSQLTPAQMKLTSDPSCPNKISRRPENKWTSLNKIVVNILHTSKNIHNSLLTFKQKQYFLPSFSVSKKKGNNKRGHPP